MSNGYRTLSQHLNDLKKENFSLKLRIYFLEERMQQKYEASQEDVYKRVSEGRRAGAAGRAAVHSRLPDCAALVSQRRRILCLPPYRPVTWAARAQGTSPVPVFDCPPL